MQYKLPYGCNHCGMTAEMGLIYLPNLELGDPCGCRCRLIMLHWHLGQVIMMVAGVLLPKRHQGISSNHDDMVIAAAADVFSSCFHAIIVTVKSSWWLLMSWCLKGTRASAAIRLTLPVNTYQELPNVMIYYWVTTHQHMLCFQHLWVHQSHPCPMRYEWGWYCNATGQSTVGWFISLLIHTTKESSQICITGGHFNIKVLSYPYRNFHTDNVSLAIAILSQFAELELPIDRKKN